MMNSSRMHLVWRLLMLLLLLFKMTHEWLWMAMLSECL
jgi:hypothetical protein